MPGQIITFTFPHIGNVGTNEEDTESVNAASSSGVRGVVLAAAVTDPSNWRATRHLDAWLKARGIVGLTGIDTRALTALIRDKGMPNAVIAHDPDGLFDLDALKARAAGPALDGRARPRAAGHQRPALRLARDHVGARARAIGRQARGEAPRRRDRLRGEAQHSAAARPRRLQGHGRARDGDGRGRPGAQARRRLPLERPGRPGRDGRIRRAGHPGRCSSARVPTFGICLGHQMLGLAVGGRTMKMHQGHHGANHPVKDKTTGKVEITSMNHGFAVDPDSLPATAVETHVSLFDGSNGIRQIIDSCNK